MATGYEVRIAALERTVAEGARRLRRFADARLAVFAAGVVLAVFAYRGSALATAGFGAAAVGFAFLVRRHDRQHEVQAFDEALLTLCRRLHDRASERWHAFTETGGEFRDAEHPYSGDLDIFGQGSLFQWTGGVVTHVGRRRLAERLAAGPRQAAEIAADQAAVEALAPELDWRLAFFARGMSVRAAGADPEALLGWAEEKRPLLTPFLRVVRWLPLATLGLLAAAYAGLASYTPAVLLVIAQASVFFSRAKALLAWAERLRRSATGVEAYRRMLAEAERCAAMSARIDMHTQRLRAERAAAALARLELISTWLEVQRIGLVHLILNVLVLWDVQFFAALDAWRGRHGGALRGWIESLAALEGLAVWAGVRHDFPAWTMPRVGDELRGVAGTAVGHPLIAAGARVANPVALPGPGSLWVLTGSNMSGKSTYERTLGVNLVLAYAGAPVCAERFECGRFAVHTSMRNVDNLEKSVSSFYAELARMKRIVEAARGGVPVLFLLDEIFRGTNSEDRIAGAQTVLQNLLKAGALGIVSTHDLELGRWGENAPGVEAYHFEEQYEDGRIVFDYTLRPGVSRTRNALALMRLVGIVD